MRCWTFSRYYDICSRYESNIALDLSTCTLEHMAILLAYALELYSWISMLTPACTWHQHSVNQNSCCSTILSNAQTTIRTGWFTCLYCSKAYLMGANWLLHGLYIHICSWTWLRFTYTFVLGRDYGWFISRTYSTTLCFCSTCEWKLIYQWCDTVLLTAHWFPIFIMTWNGRNPVMPHF